MIVEHFRKPQRFLAGVRAARAAGKQVVLLHPGKSAAAAASAATHTGAMAGDYAVMATHASHAGAILVDTLEELGDVVELLVRYPAPPSSGVGVIAESGALKAMMLDQAEAAGLELPQLSNEDSPALRAALPEFVPVSNPLDVTAQGLVDPGIYGRTIDALVHDERIGGILVNLIQTDVGTSHIKFTAVLDALTRLRPEKPVLVAGVDEGGGVLAEDIAAVREAGAMYLPTAERALRALARVSKAAEPSPAVVGNAKPLEGLPQSGTVAEYRSKALLSEYGIPFPQHELARTVEEAVTVAERLGYPIVLKAQAADLAHKSDAGGVIVGLADADAVREGWARLQANVSAARPDLTLDGVLVEKMGARGTELIVGARNDAHWGATLLVGFGGVTAELLHDVRLIPAGLSTGQIEAEIRKLRLAPLLDGYRGSQKLDVRAVADIVRKLGELVAATPAIKEIDLNPVVAYPEGEGAVALDALIYV
jgi:acyl-CoA synthetase (NDP forming)